MNVICLTEKKVHLTKISIVQLQVILIMIAISGKSRNYFSPLPLSSPFPFLLKKKDEKKVRVSGKWNSGLVGESGHLEIIFL